MNVKDWGCLFPDIIVKSRHDPVIFLIPCTLSWLMLLTQFSYSLFFFPRSPRQASAIASNHEVENGRRFHDALSGWIYEAHVEINPNNAIQTTPSFCFPARRAMHHAVTEIYGGFPANDEKKQGCFKTYIAGRMSMTTPMFSGPEQNVF